MYRRLVAASCIAGCLMASASAKAEQSGAEIAAIKATLDRACAGFEAGDKAAAMAPFQNKPGLVVFDFSPPRAKDYGQLFKDNAAFADMADGKPVCKYLEIHPTLLSKDAAYSWSIMRFASKFKNGKSIDVTFRSTDVWRKINGRWYSVHEQNSFPVDPFTAKADLHSAP